MKVVRQGVFETNSSSTHSISIATQTQGALMDTLPLDKERVLILEGGEFGWEEASYKDALTKANYMAIYALQWGKEESGKFIKIFEDVVKEQTGARKIEYAFTTSWQAGPDEVFAYIDHQSVENKNYHYVFQDREKLRQFIFNPLSVLKTDNDNHW